METTLHEENLIVEKVTYSFKNPDPFDIITFYPKGRNADEYYIKRVMPGKIRFRLREIPFISMEKC